MDAEIIKRVLERHGLLPASAEEALLMLENGSHSLAHLSVGEREAMFFEMLEESVRHEAASQDEP
jgi:hypothetical protein